MIKQKVDVKKIITLGKAGWGIEKIAAEMHMELDNVKKILSEYVEAEKKQEKESEEIEKEDPLVFLTSNQLKVIYEKAAAIGAKEALKTFEEERKKELGKRADRRLRNTKLLLRNYHMLKEHAENSVFGRAQMKESAFDILESMMSIYNDEVIIQSIKNSATRTAIIVSHIETMFGLYAVYCEKSTREIEKRRYNVVWDMYMAESIMSAKEVAEKMHMSTDSVYDDLRVAIERLTALIFGVDGLKCN